MSEQASGLPPFDTVVVGAGVSGLCARRVLKRAGFSVLLLEKSRGSGGRMTSRRGEGWTADMGAQFTAIKQPAWAEIVRGEGAEALELALPWDARHPRFAHREGMSAFARRLLREIPDASDVRFLSRVARFAIEARGETSSWKVVLESGETFFSRSVLVTAPVPQAIDLITQSGLALSEQSKNAVTPLTYTSCLAAIVELTNPLPESVPVLWKDPSADLIGIFDQLRKGLQGTRPTIVVHAAPQKSRELWDLPPEQAMVELCAAARAALGTVGVTIEIISTTLHRWRYCEPEHLHPERCLEMRLGTAAHPPLLLAGDAFGGASVDGAFSSGEHAGKRLVDLLK